MSSPVDTIPAPPVPECTPTEPELPTDDAEDDDQFSQGVCPSPMASQEEQQGIPSKEDCREGSERRGRYEEPANRIRREQVTAGETALSDPREPDGSICDNASEGEADEESDAEPDTGCLWCDNTGYRVVALATLGCEAEVEKCRVCKGRGT